MFCDDDDNPGYVACEPPFNRDLFITTLTNALDNGNEVITDFRPYRLPLITECIEHVKQTTQRCLSVQLVGPTELLITEINGKEVMYGYGTV